jgi:hypothetical protein
MLALIHFSMEVWPKPHLRKRSRVSGERIEHGAERDAKHSLRNAAPFLRATHSPFAMRTRFGMSAEMSGIQAAT